MHRDVTYKRYGIRVFWGKKTCSPNNASGTWEYLEAATPSSSPSFAAPLQFGGGCASPAHSCSNASSGASLLGGPPLSNGLAHAAAAAAHEQALAAGAPAGSGACSAGGAGGEARALGHSDELLADEVLDDSSAASEGTGSASGDPEQGAGPWARFQGAGELSGAGPGESSRPSEAPAEQAAGPALQGQGCSGEESQAAADATEHSAGDGSMASPAGGDAQPGLGPDPPRLSISGEAPSCSAAEAGASGLVEAEEASEVPASRGTASEAGAQQAPGDRADCSGAAGSGRGAGGGSGAKTSDPSGSGGAGMPEQQGMLSQESGAFGSRMSEGEAPTAARAAAAVQPTPQRVGGWRGARGC